MKKDGTEVTPLAVDQLQPRQIAVDNTSVFWTNSEQVMRVDKDGTNLELVVQAERSSYDLAVDAANVYWTDHSDETINVVPKTGGVPTALVEGVAFPLYLTIDSMNVYWTMGSANGLAARAPLAGGTFVPISLEFTHCTGVAVDGSHVYWGVQGSVKKALKDNGPPVTMLEGPFSAHGVAVDQTHLYFTHQGQADTANGSLFRIPK